MDERTRAHYDNNAPSVSEAYEASEMGALHELLLRFLPRGKPVLEIGCGSGRDAAFLAEQGIDITPIDASRAMVEEVAKRHPALADRVRNETFPFVPESTLRDRRFAGIISIATVMHCPDAELFEFALAIRDTLDAAGVLVLSFVTGLGELPDDRDDSGRLMIERPPAELRLLFERLGFRFITDLVTDDGVGRDLEWYTLVMERGDGGAARPVDEIETIISHDNKNTTYKIALLRALCDIAQTDVATARWRNDGMVELPLGLVVEKWLYYYWPIVAEDLVLPDKVAIPQQRGMEANQTLLFRKSMRELIAAYHPLGGLSAIHNDFTSGTVPAEVLPILDQALRDIETAIRKGPIVYAGSAIEGETRYFDYKRARKGKRLYVSAAESSRTLGQLLLKEETWRELTLIGHWISGSLVLRWAELTGEITRQSVPVEKVIGLLLTSPHSDRDVMEARKIFGATPDLKCTWSGKPVGKNFAVDHIIPFSLSPTNDLWNLTPSDPHINSHEKRDKLVTLPALESSKERIFESWDLLHSHNPKRFELEVRRSLIRPSPHSDWMETAFLGLRERVETLATVRGVRRWDG